MKHLKFRSLTMTIWMTFTVIILIIICSISFVYLFAYKRIDENNKIQDLKVAHNMLLKNIANDQPMNRFDEMRNLMGSGYYIVNVGEDNKVHMVNPMNKQVIDINPNEPPRELPKELQKNTEIDTPNSLFDIFRYQPPHIPMLKESEKIILAESIKGESLNEKQLKKTLNNGEYIFIISSISYGDTGKYYLISYAPELKDNNLIYMVIFIGVIFITIGFVAAKVVAGRISKPLKELEKYTVRIAHKDWKEPIEVKSDDEIGRLAEAMNRMRNELKHADEEEKSFLQSISHDLKTPVMVIMSHAEAIIDGVYIDSIEKTAEIIRDEAISLQKKIKQILYLNTLDYVLENNDESEQIDLNSFLLHIISRFEVVNSEIEWELDIDKIIIDGNIDKLQVCIENILDNGLRYAEQKICVSLKEQNSFAVLEIYNDGPNIKKENLGHIFDNLYKDKTGNFGLGLAISKKIIDFYKGEIEAVNREKGVSFIIRYPIFYDK